jgi:UDP-3-O-[3-hydroxymyristoyl] glucosamine N-acyltransferase
MSHNDLPFLNVASLASKVAGAVLGDKDLQITSACALEYRSPHSLSFVRTNSQEHLAASLAGRSKQAFIVSEELASSEMVPAGGALILVKDPYAAFLDLLHLFHPEHDHPRVISHAATIHPTARIGSHVAIGAHCSIAEEVIIGEDCVLHPGVHLYRGVHLGKGVTLHSGVSVREGCIIGDGSTVHNNTVIGADGFGYVPDPQVGLRKVPQVGNVVIGKNVEIGANTCIDRGAFGSTTIGDGTKIDNLVQIGHNASIGKLCIICGQVGIAGSVTIGDRVVMAGGSGVADHVSICANSRIGGRAGVTANITVAGDYLGFPAETASTWRRMHVALKRLALSKRRPTSDS